MLFRILLFLILIPRLLQAQATKKEIISQSVGNVKEVFYVLVEDPKIKHGLYQKIDGSGAVLLEGKYKQGKMDSVWTERRKVIGTLIWQGNYENGTKSGLWSYFDFSGKLIQQYNFSTGELGYYIEEESEKKMKTYNLFDSTTVVPERPLLYIGGMAAIIAHISTTIQYPSAALEAGESGRVYVSLVVTAFGVSEEHQVLNKVGHGFEAEALRVMKALPDQWLPAIVDGKHVSTRIVFPINFKIQ